MHLRLSGIDESKLKFLELAAFVLDLGNNFSKIREHAWDFIVMIALWHEKDRALSKDDIIKSIERIFGFKNIPSFIIENTLARLQNEGCIISKRVDKEDLFVLTSRGINKVHSVLDKRKDVENKALTIFVEILRRYVDHKLSNSDIETAKRCLYEFLGRAFNQWGMVASRLLTSGRVATDIPHYEVIIKDITSSIKNPLKDAIKYVIEEFLKRSPKNEVLAKFIASIAQSYFMVQLLNLDPELKRIQRESLANITIIIDTNVIIPLLCEAHEAHEAVKEVLEYTKSVGIKNLYITKYTRDEFIRRLKYSDYLYNLYKDDLSKLSKSANERARSLINDVFIKTYLIRKSAYPTYSWDVFMSEMENFIDILRDKYGILLDERDYNIPFNESTFQELIEAIKTANPEKPEATVKHDAIHIYIVDELRKHSLIQELVGPRYWFLTRDKTLCFAEVTLLGKSMPSSIHIKTWFDIISPFISADTSKTLAELLALPLVVEEEVDPEQVLFGISVLGPLLEDPNISVETIKGIIGSSYMKKHLERLKELQVKSIQDKAFKLVLEREREKLREEISKELKRELVEKERKIRYRDIAIIVLGMALALAVSYIITLHINIVVGVISALGGFGFIVSIMYDALKAILKSIWNKIRSK